MTEAFILDSVRDKLLLKFFLNSRIYAYSSELVEELRESNYSIRNELSSMEEEGLLQSFSKGKKRFFKANTAHPRFLEIHHRLRRETGLEQVGVWAETQGGAIEKIFLVGDFAKGKDSTIIDLVIVGPTTTSLLVTQIGYLEDTVRAKVRYLLYSAEDYAEIRRPTSDPEPLLLWPIGS